VEFCQGGLHYQLAVLNLTHTAKPSILEIRDENRKGNRSRVSPLVSACPRPNVLIEFIAATGWTGCARRPSTAGVEEHN
jgi:hypothetical protein